MIKQIRLYAAYGAPPALLILWLYGFAGTFKAELEAAGTMGRLFKMDTARRTALANGPMYELSRKASELIPSGSRIFFLNPPVAGAVHYPGKARYYLYPLDIIVVNSEDNLNTRGFRPGDYLLVYLPSALANPNFEKGLASFLSIDKVYGVSDKKGLQAIYRVTG